MSQAEKEKRDQATHDMVNALHTAIVGINGKGGLIEAVKEVTKSHYTLKRNFSLLVGTLAGSGLLVGGLSLLIR